MQEKEAFFHETDKGELTNENFNLRNAVTSLTKDLDLLETEIEVLR